MSREDQHAASLLRRLPPLIVQAPERKLFLKEEIMPQPSPVSKDKPVSRKPSSTAHWCGCQDDTAARISIGGTRIWLTHNLSSLRYYQI